MIEFLKTQDYEVKDPIYNFDENAGIDVYIPENTPEFVSVFKEKKLDVRNMRLVRRDGGQDVSATIIFSKKDNINDVMKQLETIGKITSIEITTFG